MSWLRRAEDRLARERDIANRRAAAAEADTRRLQRALDALPIGVVLADAAGVQQVRNTASRFAGHSEVLVAEALERNLLVAARGSASAQTVDLFGPPRQVLLVHAIPLADGGALATVEDISERARLDAVRTDFVANISHELKTPVGALAVLAEAVADDDDLAVMHRLASKMVGEAHRASRTIDDLLELSRIELGGQAVRDVVDVGAVIEEAVHRGKLNAERRGIRLDVVEPHPPKALGDIRQLVSALANLIDNAVKYSDDGSVVTIDARGADGWVELSVSDHGVGIPARDLDRIFERFYRVDRARSRETGGTGLGLAIVRHVATNHGGEVSVQSREGEGSTFVLPTPASEGSRIPN